MLYVCVCRLHHISNRKQQFAAPCSRLRSASNWRAVLIVAVIVTASLRNRKEELFRVEGKWTTQERRAAHWAQFGRQPIRSLEAADGIRPLTGALV